VRLLSGRQCFQALPENYSQTFLVIDCEDFAAPRAQPEVFYGMTVRRKRALCGDLLETIKTALPIIKIRRAFRVGTFQIHQLDVAPFLMGSHTHLKSKIRFGPVSVKLIKSIVRIGMRGAFGDIFKGRRSTVCGIVGQLSF
jgi:hypothetical protein